MASARVRTRVDHFLHHPVTEMGLVVLIVASVALLVLEALYDFAEPAHEVLVIAGDVITAIFVLELVLRFWVARKKRRFVRHYWIDMLAVMPLTRPLRFFRVLRLLRLFRAGSLLHRRITLFRGVFQGAIGELTLLGTLTVVLIFAATVILYVAERHAPFDHVGESMWYSLFVMLAGEPVNGTPQTGVGRAVTAALMFGGMTIFGIFVGTISAAMVSRLSKRDDVQEVDLEELSGHVVVCGWNASGRLLLRELFGSRDVAPVVMITEGEALPSTVPKEIVQRELLYHVTGDYTRIEALERANIRQASAVIILADSLTPRSEQDRDARTVLCALTIERLCPGIFTCAELRNRDHTALLHMAGVDEIVVPEEYSGVILGSVTRNRGLVRVLDEILTTQFGNSFHKVTIPDAWVGRTVRELFILLKEKHDAVLVSIDTVRDGARPESVVNPPLDRRIERGSIAVVISSEPLVLGH